MTVTNAIFEPSEGVVPNAEVPDKPMLPVLPVLPVLLRPLSPRESQIVRLLDQGRTPKEVAFELGIANATVRVLLSRAVKKGGRAPRRA